MVLDRQITLRLRSMTTDDYGGPEWTNTDRTVRAKVKYAVGGESKEDDAVHRAKENITFTIRFGHSPDANTVIIYEDNEYDVESIIEIGRHQYQELKTVRRA